VALGIDRYQALGSEETLFAIEVVRKKREFFSTLILKNFLYYWLVSWLLEQVFAWSRLAHDLDKGHGTGAMPELAQVLGDLKNSLQVRAEEFVPWFLEQMPPPYFRDVDKKTQQEHMLAALSLITSQGKQRIRVVSHDERNLTYIMGEDRPGMLRELLHDFGDILIRSAKMYSSKDKRLVIDSFELGELPSCDPSLPDIQSKLQQVLAIATSEKTDWSLEQLQEHFAQSTLEYVKECPAKRILDHANLVRIVRENGGSAGYVEDSAHGSRITLAVSNTPAKRMLTRIAYRLATRDLNIVRAFVDTISAGEEESVVIVSTVVHHSDGRAVDPKSAFWGRLYRDLLRLKWLEPQTMDLAYREAELGLGGADVLHTYCNLVHQLLVKKNRYVYSNSRIFQVAEQYMDFSKQLVNLFWDRFNPEGYLNDEEFQTRVTEIQAQLTKDIEDEVERLVLETMLLAISKTLKTNYFVVGRYALALRLSPELVVEQNRRPEQPFGVFWVHGRDFNAFHVRFRDIARGGVRVVRPSSQEQFVRETERHLDEVYDLAYAQQLKNKDIPEGGSKAVILVRPGQTITRCVRAFSDSLLDLITQDETTRERIVDHYHRPEWIFLGPDENITPAHIDWIVSRAKLRGYAFPNALMSSKVGAGINHKEYGVTSEGVNVFLEVALRHVGINPRKQSFTVKITGGPDGDVAGNEIKILIREYGDNAKIVGIADGFGCAEDPEGLDHKELLRLVHASLPISEYQTSLLSPKGIRTVVQDAEGSRLRNELHNRVWADAFIPAGGRPATINEENWQRYLDEKGKPSSRVIVEGANLFITPFARQKLFEAGVVVVKDSSANKCGVICSSFEILACLMLSEQEFLTIKTEFVQEVLVRLREIARVEAVLLFEEHRRRPKKSLVELSILFSREINRLKDAVASSFAELEQKESDIVHEMVLGHIPNSLEKIAGERIWNTLPADYREQIVCSKIASGTVYLEGLEYLKETPDEKLPELAMRYLRRRKHTLTLVRELEGSSLPHKQEIAQLLRLGGTRTGLAMDDRR
jgi:glutamate dehydrogenase